ncbi:histone-lysine N-methyltransferase SETMAR [Trichonephila clavata]|uniref:Histone-lysine N-methyltransferase SETMAR n=1 Tax=Trichonephila clavata TaxID=2740835 RepID=A0A8X6HQP2_TRICU|nr:histone-lysine N-methyltransferase SETMAR [Trichonephila clavata]
MPVTKIVDKTTQIIEVDRHISSRSIEQEVKIEHRTALIHLHKAGFKKLDVWVPHQFSINMMDQISSCKALTKQNKIDPFLKKMVNRVVRNVSYNNVVQKR